jgi:TIR domain
VADDGQTRLGLPSRASRIAGLGNQRSERAGFRRRVLPVLLPGLVGVAGLTQDSKVILTSAVLSLLLAVIGALGEFKLRRRRDGLPAWREGAPWRTRPGRASGIFISYRHNDAGPYARLLQVYLLERFPHAPVFMDLDSIEAGADFVEAIEAGVGSCRVLVALIGPKWLMLADEEGRRRLDHPDDWIRFEIGTALKRRVRVIPVLVDGAKMPRQQQLPTDLSDLARLNALEMSYDRYAYDISRLAGVIQRALATGSDGQE